MYPEVGTVAASSNDTSGGFFAIVSSGTAAYSAKAAPFFQASSRKLSPKTSSPAPNSRTRAPTASTTPARSVPGTGSFGRSSPAPIRRRTYGRPVTMCHTSAWTDAARTRTSTSPSAGSGVATSRRSRTSSGGP